MSPLDPAHIPPPHATGVKGMPPLSTVCGHMLRRAQQVHNALWFARVGSDFTSPQYAVLEAIIGTPGLDQRRLGDLASLDKSSTMDVVERLARRGLIERRRDPADGRRDILDPSPGAIEALRTLRPHVGEVQKLLLDRLSADDRPRFVERLARVARFPANFDETSPLYIPGHLLRRAQQVHTTLFAAEFDRELTGPQFAALQVIAENPGVSQRELGELAALDKSTGADLVRRLDRRGWVIQQIDPDDRRRRTLTLSPDAARACVAFSPRVLRVQLALLEPLGAESEAFLIALAPVSYRLPTAE